MTDSQLLLCLSPQRGSVEMLHAAAAGSATMNGRDFSVSSLVWGKSQRVRGCGGERARACVCVGERANVRACTHAEVSFFTNR